MIVIRQEQVAAMARETFIAPGIEYLRRHFARRTADRSPADLAALVRSAVERACAYGIPSAAGWCRFLSLIMALGERFDDDPQFAWVVEILRDPSMHDGNQRALAAAQAVAGHLLAEHARVSIETPPA